MISCFLKMWLVCVRQCTVFKSKEGGATAILLINPVLTKDLAGKGCTMLAKFSPGTVNEKDGLHSVLYLAEHRMATHSVSTRQKTDAKVGRREVGGLGSISVGLCQSLDETTHTYKAGHSNCWYLRVYVPNTSVF